MFFVIGVFAFAFVTLNKFFYFPLFYIYAYNNKHLNRK